MSRDMPAIAASSTLARPPRAARRGERAWLHYELRRALRPRRAAALYALALLPALVTGLAGWLARLRGAAAALALPAGFYARLFDGLILRTVVFFGCAWLFIQLARGELTGRTLHYAWLTPVRRGWLGWCKYLAGASAAVALFGGGTLLSRLVVCWTRPTAPAFSGPALAGMLGFAAVAGLACLGYGAVFFWVGARFAQPLLPALAFYGWEQINFLLPAWLQRCSIIYYLHALHPGAIPRHEWGFVPPPISIASAIAWLLAISGAMAWLAVRRFQRLEINYGGEE